jgi:hypothetical protein
MLALPASKRRKLNGRRPKEPRAKRSLSDQRERGLQYWTKALNCTEAKLRAAVKAVGVMVSDVRAYLAKHK